MTILTPEQIVAKIWGDVGYSPEINPDGGFYDHIKMLTEQLALREPQWLPIADALRDGTFILVVHPSGHINIQQYGGDEGQEKWRRYPNDWHNWTPTHYMPLPKPPTEGTTAMTDITVTYNSEMYVLVPRVPTEKMLGEELAYFDFHRADDAASIYKAMIAAYEREQGGESDGCDGCIDNNSLR